MTRDRTGRVHRKKVMEKKNEEMALWSKSNSAMNLSYQASLRKEAAVLRSKQIIDLKGWSRTANFQSELLSRNVFQKLAQLLTKQKF